MSTTRNASLLIAALAALAQPAAAYDFFVKTGPSGRARLGDPLDQSGTSRTSSSPPIEIRINTLRVDDTDKDGNADASGTLGANGLANLTQVMTKAIGYWNAVPGTGLRLVIGGQEASSTIRNVRPYILVTTGRLPNDTRAVSWTRHSSNGQFYPLGLHVNNLHLDNYHMFQYVIHELGHLLGLAESSCDRMLTNNQRFGRVVSGGAFMSGRSHFGRAALHRDDQSAARDGFPTPQTAALYGTIKGELVDDTGASVFGGNVFVVNQNNVAVASRLSGLTDWTGTKRDHGKFAVAGLEPGTYTVVAAPTKSTEFRIGHTTRYPFDRDYAQGWLPAFRTDVVVHAGETVDLGDVQTGTEQAHATGTVLSWAAYPGAFYYKVYLYNQSQSVWEIRGRRFDQPGIQIDLDPGRYKLTVRAHLGASSEVAKTEEFEVGGAPPLTFDAPDEVTHPAGTPLDVAFTLADPLGGNVYVTASNTLPDGLVITRHGISWPNPTTGDHVLQLVAREYGGGPRTVERTLTLRITAPPTHTVGLTWSALPGEQLYRLRFYSQTGRYWLPLEVSAGTRIDRDLIPGDYRVHFYQRELGRWTKIGSKDFSVVDRDLDVVVH